MNIEDLKKIADNFDSETAKKIADAYISQQYFSSILAFICVMSLVAVLGITVYKTFKD